MEVDDQVVTLCVDVDRRMGGQVPIEEGHDHWLQAEVDQMTIAVLHEEELGTW